LRESFKITKKFKVTKRMLMEFMLEDFYMELEKATVCFHGVMERLMKGIGERV
jgi:hypothetical protein